MALMDHGRLLSVDSEVFQRRPSIRWKSLPAVVLAFTMEGSLVAGAENGQV